MGTNNITNCPENFILLGTPNTQMTEAERIIFQMKASHPEKFEGSRDFFSFELRYAAPFDKGFYELKRLQGTASEVAGRRNEFKGYIVMDMSSWLTHHDEEYLNKALLFFVDMSDYWKFIFLVDNQNLKAARELVGKILSVFYGDHIPCSVKEEKEKCSYKECLTKLCIVQGITCSTPVKEVLQDVLEQGFGEDVVSALLSELSWRGSRKISMDAFANFVNGQESLVRYMLTQKEHNRLLAIIEQRKEQWYGEKEAV